MNNHKHNFEHEMYRLKSIMQDMDRHMVENKMLLIAVYTLMSMGASLVL